MAQIVSAFPATYPYRVWIAVGLVVLVMVVNLRGVKNLVFIFAIPTYYFLIVMAVTVIVGMSRYLFGHMGIVVNPPPISAPDMLQPITFFLILKAFASGTTALTGVEAISNGITAFREPRSQNAGRTLVWMAVILGALLIGITYLAYVIQAVPSDEETVFSQLARTIWNTRGILYLAVISSTTIILVMAANTAFADFSQAEVH